MQRITSLTGLRKRLSTDLESVLKQPEPAYLSKFIGPDEFSQVYPEHKEVRLTVLHLLTSTHLRLGLISLFLFPWLLICFEVSQRWSVRLVWVSASVVLFGAVTKVVINHRIFPDVECTFMFWELLRRRTDLSITELSRVNHVYYVQAWLNLFRLILLCILTISVPILLAVRHHWLLAGVGILLSYCLWVIWNLVANHINFIVFDANKRLYGDSAMEAAEAQANAGKLFGDRSPRSAVARNLTTGRHLRMPAVFGSIPLAYIGGFSYWIGTLFVFIPIIWFALHSWLVYTPLAQIAVLLAMWLLHQVVLGYRSRDDRRFQTVLLRPFRPEPSFQAKNAILPVLGGVGVAITIEDWNLMDSKERSLPFAVSHGPVVGEEGISYVREGNWKDQVLSVITDSDAAIIDITDVTEQIRWEIDRCIEQLPQGRIIFVGNRARISANLLSIAVEHGKEPGEMAFVAYQEGVLGRIEFKWRLLRLFRQMRAAG